MFTQIRLYIYAFTIAIIVAEGAVIKFEYDQKEKAQAELITIKTLMANRDKEVNERLKEADKQIEELKKKALKGLDSGDFF